MADIVERLRWSANREGVAGGMMLEAAAEIERLRARVEALDRQAGHWFEEACRRRECPLREADDIEDFSERRWPRETQCACKPGCVSCAPSCRRG